MNDNTADMPELALGTKVLREEYVNGAARPVVVLGIGNILLSDEGFGVRVVEYLSEQGGLPDNVELVEQYSCVRVADWGGTREQPALEFGKTVGNDG